MFPSTQIANHHIAQKDEKWYETTHLNVIFTYHSKIAKRVNRNIILQRRHSTVGVSFLQYMSSLKLLD